MKTTITILVAVLVLVVSHPAMAFTQFKDGQTHNISSTISDDVWVDWQAPGMQTTVNMLAGGSCSLLGFTDSRINVSGGTVSLSTNNDSQATISGGTVSLSTNNDSQATISGGTVGYLDTHDDSQVTMSGGTVGSLQTFDHSRIIMTGGLVRSLHVYQAAQVTISGGTVSYLGDYYSAQITMSGGTIEQDLRLWLTATLVLEGYNFSIDGTPFGFGEITSILGGRSANEPYRRLTGTLANGDPIDNQFMIWDSASITLVDVPEPATMSLFAIGGIFLLRRKK